jgi:predicted metal-dependent enzyme (double-stranded beta helix superfamily)
MDNAFTSVVDRCKDALATPDPQATVATILFEAAKDPAIVDAINKRTKFSSLEDLAIHRSERLTLLAGSLTAGFHAAPHNHNLWSVVGVCAGQEDNEFFVRGGKGLERTGAKSVVAPGVLPNAADVIHSIHNPLDTPLVVLHAYGGDLFATPRSNWNPETNEEVPYDWAKVRSKE